MRCISPILVRSPRFKGFVPCGKCNFCLQDKRADWTFRLTQELHRCHSAHFLTLTYNDAHLPTVQSPADSDGVVNPDYGKGQLSKRDVQLFTKRLRKWQSHCSDNRLRYYLVGEYGTKTQRPHYHSILFNAHPSVIDRLPEIWAIRKVDGSYDPIGNVQVGTVTPASIHYVTKYLITAQSDYGGREPPFSFMSKRPGIGSEYLRTHERWHLDDMRTYVQTNGIMARLPRYYKDKLFSPQERKRMADSVISESDKRFLALLDELEKSNPDSFRYYEEMVAHKHENLIKSLTKNDKF